MSVSREEEERASIERDVVGYLKEHEKKELLRFVAVGSVDDGKSTLIGRLLHDVHGVYEDQLSAVKRASIKGQTRGDAQAKEIDFSLFTDGLKAEREQGITIDVAYRYFATKKRKFIIADTPGHVQYTRNMATGASTADVALILIDARLGILPQSRRHAFVAALLGIPHLVVCVNKMDLRGYEQAVFDEIARDFRAFAGALGEKTNATPFRSIDFLPISALRGDNVVLPSAAMPWWKGGTLLERLETIPIVADRNLDDLRFPVQYVIRPDLTYRGYAAQIASGVVRVGDEVEVLPSRKHSRVVSIDTFEGAMEEAFAPMSVSIRLADEIDVSRGDMLVLPGNRPSIATRFEATLVWMTERALDPERSYFVKHTTQIVRAKIEKVVDVTDPETLEPKAAGALALNEIGRVVVSAQRPLFFDPYVKNRATGAFIVIDAIRNETVGAGMIIGERAAATTATSAEERGQVGATERRARLGQEGAIVEVIEETLEEARAFAWIVERVLFDRERVACVVEDERGALACARGGLVAIHPKAGERRAIVRTMDTRATELVIEGKNAELNGRKIADALEHAGVFS